MLLVFCFTSRRRHTRCALVTGVQTCALPIYSALVNPNTRARVRELARQHGYALNVTARNLRLRRSHTVAVIVEMAPTPERPMSGPYPLELLGGISQELTSAGYSVLLSARHGAITPATQAADGEIGRAHV